MIELIHKNKRFLAFFSGVFILTGLLLGLWGKEELKSFSLILSTLAAGIPIGIKAMQALRMKAFSIELLVTIAVIGALFIGEYTESSIVAFLFLFGAYLEVRTLEKTRANLKELMNMAPETATVIQNGKEVEIPVEAVAEGDYIIIRSGGKVPVDGRIIKGQAALSEAAITGESIPVMKRHQDKVFSGTIVDSGYVEVIAEKVGENTAFAKIIELVEEAQASKTKTEKFLDRFAQLYTPSIVLLSLLVYVLTKDIHLAITFLVIACPGALVIGAPVSNVAGIGNGAKHGILVKGGEVMEKFSKADVLIFDKTGTLTKGKPTVTDIQIFSDQNVNDLLKIVAEAESISEHHLGKAIINEAHARGIKQTEKPINPKVAKGKGIYAVVAGSFVMAGNRQLMKEAAITISEEAAYYAAAREQAGNTAIFAAIDGKIAAIISIADQIREDAPAAISALKRNGIKRILLLTGDNKATAKLVADQLGIGEYHFELLPENKVEVVKKLQNEGHIVAMIGDGINDAPAIAAADVGLAMGESGTDAAIETADIVLLADKLIQLPHAYALSKATIRNMKENTFFAVGMAFLLLLGVLLESVHLASGMFIHEASVLIVILHGMRLTTFQQKREQISRKKGQVVKHRWEDGIL
ncbi:cation-translocating P-type ATPase [Niallia sp. NCCP-28]|uniref:heavy metal translocating P-type ATPase n=1 Tax=Niallia sp. NCCP-28 TaxID=2934712 RepID=UPI002081BFB5|nr:cation-translocating P-type ATPase [Niallia sp. NCCP-28]GKU83562.1 haloacid dehalogenase [Niallia sp. NCCP-28]